ncbi:LOG family protein [Streptomyces acidiscabies]|uniref:LOG family protein n=1 Tax=Streptomyces acidiscabies TaxID=42234 RepID=A0AAP6BFV6_9ACTN|nr:LOG family protein [Streptomyces acidiscabies]MBP5936525.1 Rossmann fold nucleotide-binding protein [Streptomyces sp. LBUM 1476]MBZ3915491.1 LOG family protein [Streptomyces acidiscabies]MDX2963961.1 LOG family protein [Streptomyces acidiscabies]MDX3022485.1 LOG family protein [Streptomyces acidiscabies]MDX3794487.1 LOG family protein [Streptomyces acidiscabies]
MDQTPAHRYDSAQPYDGIPDREIESLPEFDEVIATVGTLARYRVQAVDLTTRTPALLTADTSGAVFLGCPMTPEADAHVRSAGALVFPPIPGLPFDPYRGLLYTPDELFEGLAEGYEHTPDAQTYAWFQQTKADGDIFASMLRSVHDDAVSDALDELLVGARVVGVMGGHAMARGTDEYAGAARLGRTLARAGLTVATGGGPGAMEAANLGAYAAPFEDAMLEEALQLLAKAPTFTPSVTEWASAAFEVRAQYPGGGPSVGIPTWFYGHEPPNAFAAHTAKYFSNATREDGLLARCTAGVVFLPGAAGTVQEIFDNSTPNYYESRGEPRPMVLVDEAHWTRRLPAWPLLEALAKDRSMAARITLVDRIEDAPEALKRAGN